MRNALAWLSGPWSLHLRHFSSIVSGGGEGSDCCCSWVAVWPEGSLTDVAKARGGATSFVDDEDRAAVAVEEDDDDSVSFCCSRCFWVCWSLMMELYRRSKFGRVVGTWSSNRTPSEVSSIFIFSVWEDCDCCCCCCWCPFPPRAMALSRVNGAGSSASSCCCCFSPATSSCKTLTHFPQGCSVVWFFTVGSGVVCDEDDWDWDDWGGGRIVWLSLVVVTPPSLFVDVNVSVNFRLNSAFRSFRDTDVAENILLSSGAVKLSLL